MSPDLAYMQGGTEVLREPSATYIDIELSSGAAVRGTERVEYGDRLVPATEDESLRPSALERTASSAPSSSGSGVYHVIEIDGASPAQDSHEARESGNCAIDAGLKQEALSNRPPLAKAGPSLSKVWASLHSSPTAAGAWVKVSGSTATSYLQKPLRNPADVVLRDRRAVSLSAPPRKPGNSLDGKLGHVFECQPAHVPFDATKGPLPTASPSNRSSPGSEEARDQFPEWEQHSAVLGNLPLLHRSVSSVPDYSHSDQPNSAGTLPEGYRRGRAMPSNTLSGGATPGRRRPSMSRQESLIRTRSGGLVRPSLARGNLGSRLMSWLSWGSNIDTCRICALPDTSEEPLINLGCACQHGLEKAHESCIKQWFESRGTNECEVCKQTAVNIPAPPPLPTQSSPPPATGQRTAPTRQAPSRLASADENEFLQFLGVFSLHRRPLILVVWGVLIILVTRIFFGLLSGFTTGSGALLIILGVLFGVLVVLGVITLARIMVELYLLLGWDRRENSPFRPGWRFRMWQRRGALVTEPDDADRRV